MKERIKLIMDSENMSPARFADTLQIGRAVISHILNGRNNPSLDVITRILNHFPSINSDWLLSGIGTMYKIDSDNQKTQNASSKNISPDLFAQISQENLKNLMDESEDIKYRKENVVDQAPKEQQNIINERIIYKETPAKKIRQIIIYYTDNTFETFSGG